MLEIEVPACEYWVEETEEFMYYDGCTIKMEHSLVSLAEWESRYKKPFLETNLSPEEKLVYYRYMTLNKEEVPIDVYLNLTMQDVKAINDYIDDPMTATWFREDKKNARTHEIVTAEIIYYWMIALQIPMECQYWHLKRLLTLIRVCNEKNQPDKKMSNAEILARNRALNEARRKKLNSRG